MSYIYHIYDISRLRVKGRTTFGIVPGWTDRGSSHGSGRDSSLSCPDRLWSPAIFLFESFQNSLPEFRLLEFEGYLFLSSTSYPVRYAVIIPTFFCIKSDV
jgi:hypothetical protein